MLAVTGGAALQPQRLLGGTPSEREELSNRAAGVKADDAVQLRPSADLSLFRVRTELDVKGNADLPRNPLISRERQRQLPIQSEAVFDYEERYRRPAGAVVGSPVTACERYYLEGERTSVVADERQQVSIRDAVRRVIVRRDTLPEVIYAKGDYFTHDELQLLHVPASSAAVDELLPEMAVRKGSKYSVDGEALWSLLNLSVVDACDVQAEVVDITDSFARIELRGKVEGAVEGVTTVIRLLGKLTFDRRQRVSTWLAMALHETREIGNAEPGFDVTATIKMLRKPLIEPARLQDTPSPIQFTSEVPPQRLLINISSDELGFSALMDRRWRMMRDIPGSAVMRMIDHDRSIAQCVFRSPAKLEPGRHRTLEAFQDDVRQTLGDQLREVLKADQRLTDSGLRALTVTAQGEAEGVPVLWILLHLSDDSGRRLLATFTMDGDSVDAFSGSDVQLANSLRLVTPSREPADPAPEEVTHPEDQEKDDSEVASLSDLQHDELQSEGKVR